MDEDHVQSRQLSVPPPSAETLPSTSSSSLTSSPLQSETTTTPTTEEVQVQVRRSDTDTSDQHHQHRRHNSRRNRSLRVNTSEPEISPGDIRDDFWYCLAVLVTFWFFASMTLILGFYGSLSFKLGPNCSKLVTENQLFVQSIQAQQIDDIPGPMLYGFHTTPALDVETTWTETHGAYILPDFHKEWVYNLNAGSKLDIAYDVTSSNSAPVSLIIAQGEESLIEWIEYPLFPNTTLSWNIIYGSGRIEQEIKNSDTYYVAVGNLNSQSLEVDELHVQLNITVKALLYNTTQAHSRCSLYNRVCSFSLMLLKSNAVILTSPGPEQMENNDWYWYITLSYGPRWLTFVLSLGIISIVALVLFKYCNMFRRTQSGTEDENLEPLLSPKDDDLSSWGSSYDSVSNDEDEFEEWGPEEGESTTDRRKLCVICFDSPRDCFFLPCGHCAACFTCGSRIGEDAGTCPICRRRMKKVRRIFSV